jgi:hypothetical protein
MMDRTRTGEWMEMFRFQKKVGNLRVTSYLPPLLKFPLLSYVLRTSYSGTERYYYLKKGICFKGQFEF